MPEGDTIHRTATRLRRVIVDKRICRVSGQDRWLDANALLGHTIRSIDSRGKHLLMHMDDERVIHSHMGMTGSWHVYAPGETWRKPRKWAALELEFSERPIAVCFTPMTLELLSTAQLMAVAIGTRYRVRRFRRERGNVPISSA